MHSWYTGIASPSNIIQVQYDNGISTALRDPVLIRSTPFHIQENLYYMPHVLQFATILLGLIDCVTVSFCFNSKALAKRTRKSTQVDPSFRLAFNLRVVWPPTCVDLR